jgi:TRAP-type C4-dicarboxylate transport system substrate-binding protein
VADTFDAQADTQRADNQKLDASLEDVLTKNGMVFAKPDVTAFQKVLTQAGFYKQWQGKFGAPLWSALESVTGAIA